MRPTVVTASEEVVDIVLECQTVNVPNVNRGNSVQVRILYRRDNVMAIRHNLRREPSLYWLGILQENVCVEAGSGRFMLKNMNIRWLNQTEDPLCYAKGDTCNKNSPKCIMTDSRGILFEGDQFLVPPEENIRLSRIANGDEEAGDQEQQHVEEEEMEEVLYPVALPPRLPGVSLSGRRTTCFLLS